jgi:hypothetical protein
MACFLCSSYAARHAKTTKRKTTNTEVAIVKHSTRPLALQGSPEPACGCPFCREYKAHTADAISAADVSCSDSQYAQARRQGIYLAACVIDEVAALGIRRPEAVVDEIRRRICELVRFELSETPGE